jgi:hypothetical protein
MAPTCRSTRETRALQVWPSGQGFEYRGDPSGPEHQRELRERGGEWRQGTAEEWRRIRCEERARLYLDREVLCCDSALISELTQHAETLPLDDREAFSIDAIRNLTPDPSEWDAPTCLHWLADHTGEDNYRRRAEDWPGEVARFAAYEGQTAEEWEDAALAELQDAIRDQAEPAEVFEWWRVSSWLCKHLDAIGEVTIDNGYGCWYGRTTTGQGLLMDGVLQRVAARFEE